MSLDDTTLKGDLEANFAAPGETIAACATQWATAVAQYASGVVPPSTAVAAAETALQASLVTAFGSAGAGATAGAMESAFLTFATSVGGGMTGFTPTPPTGLVGFADLFAADPLPEAHADAAEHFAAAIHAWFTTGKATLVAPPNTESDWS